MSLSFSIPCHLLEFSWTGAQIDDKIHLVVYFVSHLELAWTWCGPHLTILKNISNIHYTDSMLRSGYLQLPNLSPIAFIWVEL